MTTLEELTRIDGIFQNVRGIDLNLSCMRQIISRAADEVKRLQDEVTRMRDERDFEKKLRKDQSDRAGSWKECAELLAKHVQGVSDEDCKALEVFEKLKAREG